MIETVIPVKEAQKEEAKTKEQSEAEVPKKKPDEGRQAGRRPKEQIINDAIPKIAQQLKKILTTNEKCKQAALADQIKNKQGKIIDDQNMDEFVQKEVLPGAKVEGKSFKAKDGLERIKVKVEIPMIPEHIRVRAEKYQDLVEKYAAKYELDPCLLYAVTETESYFNPMAKSPAGAYGLMQLIPRYGAREAYQYLYHKDTILTPAQLYIPGVNVCLGGAYLKLLRDRYYKDIADAVMKQYLSIASYNWGPTAVRTRIVNRCDLDGMDHQSLFRFIRQNSPEETSEYLKKVTERMPKYRIMSP